MLLLGLILGVLAIPQSPLSAGPQSPLSDAFQIKGPDAQVTGRVLDAAAGTPMAGARVVFAFRGRSRLQVVTDPDGRYGFAGLEPGPWRLSVQKAGYAPSDAASLPTFWLVAGQSLELPAVFLEKTGTIGGRVVDSAGRPLADVSVHAVRRGATADAGPLDVQTNDRGEFLIAGLAPGEYLVVARARAIDAPSTFYPGTVDQSAAKTVGVAPGQARDAVVIVVRSP